MIYILSIIIIGLLGILIGMIIESSFQRMQVIMNKEQQKVEPEEPKVYCHTEEENLFKDF